ncbi:hypothetical protein TWF718_001046 [Orbilia javanica]|uniref:Alkylmercury lyase n=1 Tax=Orbilia javanica TaxID=47235 RepID=A0AAN8NGZ5_9PEZI
MNHQVRTIRCFIFKFYLEHCHPPTVDDIVEATSISAEDVSEALLQLEENHHIVLYKFGVPSTTPIAMAHPFSHLPTPFIVKQEERSWWANCAWCAFGLAAMLHSVSNSPITVVARSGAIGDSMLFNVTTEGIELQAAQEQAEEAVVHFCVPPSTWWTDVRFACGTIHVFKNGSEAASWCKQFGFKSGEILGLDAMWKLSKSWYHDKASFEYNRKTPDEKAQLFDSLGMVSGFWQD